MASDNDKAEDVDVHLDVNAAISWKEFKMSTRRLGGDTDGDEDFDLTSNYKQDEA